MCSLTCGFTVSQSMFDSQEGFKQTEAVIITKTVSCRMEIRAGTGSSDFPLTEEAMGELRHWKYEMNKSIVHSWESGEAGGP